MGNRIENRVILGSLRYKSAPETNLSFKVPLIQTVKQNVEFDRSLDIELEQVFQNERQNSTNFRPTCKFTVLFKNSYTGYSMYNAFENTLYFTNSNSLADDMCTPNPNNLVWEGFPQYNEFDFIRNDYNVTGYTQPPNEHLIFVPKSASTYNWMSYMSYAYDNDYNKPMTAYDSIDNNINMSWVSGDGIPFVISNNTYNGLNYVTFRCPVKHGLSLGDFVRLNLTYNGDTLFKVDKFGNGFDGSDEYIFNIINIGYTGNTFNNGNTGTFKRVILGEKSSDTTSKYYVRKHKILTTLNNSLFNKCGFEENIFGISKKYESKLYTPNKEARISIKEGAESYTLSFNQDIDISPLIDNQKRPISELFFTVIWRGYFGWTTGTKKQGWDFNLPLDSIGNPNDWWLSTNSDSNTNFNIDSYIKQGFRFFYTRPLNSGDTIDGDFCEWNDYDQKERVISNLNHKFLFDNNNFTIAAPTSNNSKKGYYYKPHYSIKIRDYSPYIEEGDVKNVTGIPNYAYFSTTKNQFIWRDIYPYGYIDNDRVGVDYPFLNGSHYPFNNFIFRIIPEGTNYIEQNIISQPITDNCE